MTRMTNNTALAMIWSLLLAMAWILLSVDASAPVPEEATVVTESDTASTSSPSLSARFVHKTVIIPHDSKKFRGGEDAASTVDDMLVVADGVGGWANRGVNPGLYSRKLTETITAAYSALSPKEKSSVDLKALVHQANHAAAAQHLGSATCTVVRLKDATTLETLNIGDSTYSIHRRKDTSETDDASSLEVVYAAEPGQKGFNFPYQLGGNYGDQVHDPGVCDGPRTHTLREKDVIVVVSDGVNDNIDAHEYHDCIHQYQWTAALETAHPEQPFEANDIVSYSAVADCIARKSYWLGKDAKHFSPFARSAASYGKRYLGGKHDDITVTVAQVVAATATAAATTATDPHRAESIFLYKDEDGPIQDVNELPRLESLLEATLEGGEPVAAEL